MAAPMKSKFRILEFYSGIGGMHYAAKESGCDFTVVGAADINTTANQVYTHNFPQTKLLQRCIESFSVKELESLDPNMILMSPPCQPFTRVGLQRDSEDPRTKSFFHILSLIPRLPCIQYILVENVKGFETSLTRNQLVDTLTKCSFTFQEFLLTPTQFGVPNSRLRYYMIAKQPPLQMNFTVQNHIMYELPEAHAEKLGEVSSAIMHQHGDVPRHTVEHTDDANIVDTESEDDGVPKRLKLSNDEDKMNDNEHITKVDEKHATTNDKHSTIVDDEHTPTKESQHDKSAIKLHEKYTHLCEPISKYLENESEHYFTDYLVKDKELKRAWVMDIVQKTSKLSCCFTKRYGHHIEGAGSQIQQSQIDMSTVFSQLKKPISPEDLPILHTLKLRYFTPREIANLLSFPQEFSFPKQTSTIQKYRVLGNSLNVLVVSKLIKLMTS
ncbi:unnamed protein product [Owenia fusiformis]|uniref:Uncharacterized protein n=1 Tax=Owenia fusiformis TaxID=6347 RepID=A0A8J1XVJ7_OWEFU|nr:unnamed protein product [Owenia fusiformis]